MTAKKKILGMDPATKTGWCLLEWDGSYVESGVQDFTKRRGETNGLMFLRFSKWLDELLDTVDVGIIAYERAHFRGGAATEVCVGLQTHLQSRAAGWQIPTAPIHTGTLKKFACGSGRADKRQMVVAAATLFGRDAIDDNEADAAHAARFAAHEYAGWRPK